MCMCCACCSCNCREVDNHLSETIHEIPVYTSLDNLERLIVPREERIQREREEEERGRASIARGDKIEREKSICKGKYLKGYGKIEEITMPYGKEDDELKVRVFDPKKLGCRYLVVKNGEITEINSHDYYSYNRKGLTQA